ncbi:MAG TPA: polysaccharide deacetylase family protein [Alphaproteobacteria bacterium]|jgi:peptidoglycan/xylan/chitin deacetylase (PgdA/CDA1 family)
MTFGLSPRALRGLAVAGAMTMFGAACAQAQSSNSRLNGEAVASHAVIFTYHRFGEAQSPATNLRLDQFDAQVQELLEGGYNVLPLADIVAALQAGETLADKTVGLSVDDAYASFYVNAWPRLRAANLPFTVFVATDSLDRNSPDVMTWDQLREMVASGLVTIGSQSMSHPHMPTADDARIAEELTKSAARIAAEIGAPPALFAYPYGEMSSRVREAVRKAGYAAAFGQHSGVAFAGEDFFYLPRFSVNERFGDMSRFRLAAQALPLPVGDVTPADPFLMGDNPPAFGFTMTADLRNIDKLGCYYADQSLQIERLGERRIEARIAKPFPPGRARLNCTLPAGNDRWRWYGTQFVVPDPSGANPPD